MNSGHYFRYIYSLFLYLLSPLFFLRLWRRGKKLPAYRKRWGERLALFEALSQQKRIWLHAVSVGEVNAAAALIEKLLSETEHKILVTTTTPTGSSLLQTRFSDRVEHVYFPYDFPNVIKRFLRKTNPTICIVMETELWPNCFHYCKKQNIPIVIVNARLSEKSVAGYQKLASLTRNTLLSTTRIFAQGKDDAERFIRLGAELSKVTVIGNLKFDIKTSMDDIQQGVELRKQWPDFDFVWVAASTHEGEEKQLIDTHKELLKKTDRSLLVIAPRHPDRFSEVANICKNSGLRFSKRTESDSLKPDTRIYLADTLGELNVLYSAVDVAFVAGSFSDIGGHNPLEPAAQGIPVITGPNVHNFSEIYTDMINQNAAVMVSNQEELLIALFELRNNQKYRNTLGEAARSFLNNCQGGLGIVTDYIIKEIKKSNA